MRLLPVIVLLLSFVSAHAQDTYHNDINSMLYIKGTFGDPSPTQNEQGLRFGFNLNHSEAALNGMGTVDLFNRNSRHHSFVDIEFSTATNYFSRFTVGGVDALEYETVMHANGTSSQLPGGLSGGQIILGGIMAAGFGYLIYSIIDDDDDDDDNNNNLDPPSLQLDDGQ